MKTNRALGHLIRKQRQAFGLSQFELGRRVGVQSSHINYIENGRRNPSLALVGRIAKALRLNRRDLFFLAFPEAKSLVSAAELPRVAKRPDDAWKNFVNSRALLDQYQVTQREMRALKQLSLLGYVMTSREFMAVLSLIRSTPEEQQS
jgi:transcriptional regulator with XRE-family HTH domain